MTREEILAMKPGRELDDLVAIDVMGYERGTHMESGLVGWFKGNSGFIGNYFKPSTDMSSAWEVFTHFGWQGQILFSGSEWHCEIMGGFDKDGVGVYGIADEETASEAICKAALLVVMEVE